MDNNKYPQFLRYIILSLILWNLPGFILVHLNDTISSMLSYLSYGVIILYGATHKRFGVNLEMVLVGILYFSISSLSNQSYMPTDINDFMISMLKYFIIVVGGYAVLQNTNSKEFYFFVFIGAISILGNIFLFNEPTLDYGRYSGFYLDPNTAGLICIIGYALTYIMPNSIGLLGKLSFTFLGLLTFSRTFILLWLFINLLSIRLSIKHLNMFVLGFGILSILLASNEFLPVKNKRLDQIGYYVSGDQTKAQGLERDSRWNTWSQYFDALNNKPLFGNGYRAFGGNGVAGPVGVHNFYLKLWGEAGIIPFSIFLYYILKLIIQSFKLFKSVPHLFLMTFSLSVFLLTNHNFFTNDFALFILLWIDINVKYQQNQVISQSP